MKLQCHGAYNLYLALIAVTIPPLREVLKEEWI